MQKIRLKKDASETSKVKTKGAIGAAIDPELEKKNSSQLDRFAQYQKQRVIAHKMNVPAPVYKDKEGVLRWANRKQRRKAQKIKK